MSHGPVYLYNDDYKIVLQLTHKSDRVFTSNKVTIFKHARTTRYDSRDVTDSRFRNLPGADVARYPLAYPA